AGGQGTQMGLTVTSVVSVALEPLVCAVFLRGGGLMDLRIPHDSRVGLALLGAHQTALARRFSGVGPDAYSFAGTPTHLLPHNILAPDGTAAEMTAVVDDRLCIHGRTMLVIRIADFSSVDASSMLYRQNGAYVSLDGSVVRP
ncbi:MAG TPA: flavin reductase, partial [Bryobacteraceae bacterium]